MSELRVFLIGRKSMCMEGLSAILRSFEGVSVIGHAVDWVDGVGRAETLAPDVVVVDMAHCAECGPTVPMDCVAELELTNVVVVASPQGMPSLVDALEAGALGYLTLDPVEPDTIYTTIQNAARGEATLDPQLSSAVLTRMRRLARKAASATTHDVSPTDREADVLELLVQGLSNREIARSLHVSESTIKNHLHAIYSKLGVESRSQAVSEAIRRGIVSQ